MLTLGLFSMIACSGDKDTADTGDTVVDTDTGADTNTDPDPPQETARVRVAHASPDAPAVDVCANGATSGFTNLSFLGTTGFADLPVGDYELKGFDGKWRLSEANTADV